MSIHLFNVHASNAVLASAGLYELATLEYISSKIK